VRGRRREEKNEFLIKIQKKYLKKERGKHIQRGGLAIRNLLPREKKKEKKKRNPGIPDLPNASKLLYFRREKKEKKKGKRGEESRASGLFGTEKRGGGIAPFRPMQWVHFIFPVMAGLTGEKKKRKGGRGEKKDDFHCRPGRGGKGKRKTGNRPSPIIFLIA